MGNSCNRLSSGRQLAVAAVSFVGGVEASDRGAARRATERMCRLSFGGKDRREAPVAAYGRIRA
jgi:hypothetical protein